MFSLDLGDNRFTGKLPAWIGESMHDLLILRLWSNSFNGNIPHQFCGLSKLHIIDMSHNHLIGHIPHCIANLSGLKSKGMEESQTPSSIGDFEWIETLDMSMNQISGPIPFSMTCLTFLNHLNLSYNNLSGKIPTTNQFLTLDDPSIYQGNAGLCGRPLSTECPDNGQRKPGGDEEDRDGDGGGKLEKLGFIISIMIGFFVGF
ncbi:receptor-like protein 13 [Ziziphus jujuba]|uniref:Receptor-like protein 13 n=1 Tax=Ziziphus jujuba TaxID=326968 RepID=A0ABM3ZS07_ZIZJJ|nr:receptor-like protein 13 [Ziziphus jujuba]